MEDRVGDVLARRAALNRGAGPGLAASVVLHGGLAAIVIYAAMHQPAPVETSVLNIRFAPMPRVSAPAAPAPIAKPAAPKKVETPKLEVPVMPTTAPPAAVAPPKTVPLSPFGRSTKKGTEAVMPPPAAPAPKPVPGIAVAGDVPLGGAGVTGLEGGDFPYTIYIERMKTLIGQHWLRPQVANGTTTTVRFVIERDGRLRDAAVETSSNNPTFDRAALRAIIETQSLPPLPFAYSGTYLGVHLTFK